MLLSLSPTTLFLFPILIFHSIYASSIVLSETEDTIILTPGEGNLSIPPLEQVHPVLIGNLHIAPILNGGGGGGAVIHPNPLSSDLKDKKCTTLNGNIGMCKGVRECYPFIYEPEDSKRETNELAIMYSQNAGFCSQKPFSAINLLYARQEMFIDVFQSLICCPDFKNLKIPPGGRPPKFQTKKPSTSTISTTTTTFTTVKPQRTTTMPMQSHKNLTMDKRCGQRKVPSPPFNQRVPGGLIAEHGLFPWAVTILNSKGKVFCGGSLISESHVLTAAHCIAPLKSFDAVTILLGAQKISNFNEPHRITRKIQMAFYHKFYNSKTISSDIGVIKLDSPVTFTNYIQPICLGSSDPIPETYGIVIGWGKLASGVHHPTSDDLRYAKIKIWKQEDCCGLYSKHKIMVPHTPDIISTMFCSGSPGMDSCNGDSGSSFQIKRDDGAFEQVGIVSWGLNCGLGPGVYTRVSHFMDWINERMKS